MILALRTCLILAAGLALGLWLTFLSLRWFPGVAASRAGPWRLVADAGTADADPYTRALYARMGALPLGASGGIVLVTRDDSSGQPLDPRCDYVIEGPMPAARLWTLAVMTPDGMPLPPDTKAPDRMVPTLLVSSSVVRTETGEARLILSRTARPGNWLALPQRGDFVLMLRLYELAAATSASTLDRTLVPTIRRGPCT
jgi:hypothetical protein